MHIINGSPKRFPKYPNISDPMGGIPKNDIVKMLITRPRFESSTMVCNKVLQEAATAIMPNPSGKLIIAASQTERTNAITISDTPNNMQEIITSLPKPNTLLRAAK